MNKKQAAYQIGRVLYNYPDVMFLGMSIQFGYNSVHHFLNSQIELGAIGGVMSLYTGFYGFLGGAARGLSYVQLNKINAEKELYPLEYSDRILIDDAEGLEFLLSKTGDGEKQEWGTVLKVYDDKEMAVVYDILDIPIAKGLGLIGEETRTSITLDLTKADEGGYKGYHHYHPDVGPRWFGARNYAIGLNDRYQPNNWINLLTFNLPEGPEVVGFNLQHTYIPTDNSRRELVRATPKQIMEYLHE